MVGGTQRLAMRQSLPYRPMTSTPIPGRAFQKGMDAGRQVALRVLQHPKASQILAAYGARLRDRVPTELAPDQIAVTDLALAVGSWPERSGWLRPEGVPPLDPGDPPPSFPIYQDRTDPRLTAGPWSAGWPELPETNRQELQEFVGELHSLVTDEAQRLVEAGVPVDPASPLDLSVLVQVALLDVRGSPEQVIAALNLSPPYALSGDGRDLKEVRDGTTADVERAASAVRRWWRSQQDGDRSTELKNQGGRPSGSRTAGADTSLVYEHLPAVLAESPRVTAQGLIRDWKRNVKGSAGVRLRDLMGRRVGDPPPSLRTLQRAIRDLRQ